MPASHPIAPGPSLGAFVRCRSGAVALIFGLAALPLALFVGAALDYSRAADTKNFLAAAADAAVLSAVTPGAMTLKAKEAEDAANKFFQSRVADARFAGTVVAKMKVNDNAKGRTATITFSADVPTTLMRLAGWSTVPVGGDATASSAPPTYIDFFMLLDNTPSMGLGATPADITLMQSNTPDKCAFACHDLSGAADYYTVAKKVGATMRIDVVRQATQQLMDTATSTAAVPGQYRAGVYTFGSGCGSAPPQTISAVTSNLSGVKSSAASVDLMTTPSQNYNNDECTDFNAALSGMNSAIASPGDGSKPSSPQKVLFFVGDGVNDSANPSQCTKATSGGRCIEPINTATCTALKNRGVKIAVLYTTYLPVPTNGFYNQWVAPFASSISPQMESCASPGLYFEVSPTGGISDAMTALFKKTVAQARIAD